jgi:MFS family permease
MRDGMPSAFRHAHASFGRRKRVRAADRRRTTGAVTPFLVTGTTFFMLLAGVNLPTPLYAVYQQRFHFSSVVLTLVFATYAIVLAPSLLLFGQLSDRYGRRTVIGGGLAASIVGLALFAIARGTPWLFATRAIQGLAVGAISGTATAALVELEPSGDTRRAALPSGIAQAGGSGAGAIAAGALAEWAPAPRTLCYLIWIGVTLACVAGIAALPEPVERRHGWHIQRPSVPAAIRLPFARATLAATAFWAVAALYLSIVPSYVRELLSTHDLALVSALSALVLVASCCAQLLSVRPRLGSRHAQATGLLLLAAGLGLLVVAFPLHSLAVVVASAGLAGAGHGLGFLASQTDINDVAPQERRGEVTSAFATCIYAGVATSVIGVGVLTLRLSLFASVTILATAIAVVAVATAWWHLAVDTD